MHLRRRSADELLAEQQRIMIEKMLGAGVDLRRQSDNVMVDLITGETQAIQGSRMCRFLPAVAKRERGEYLASLEALMSDNEMKYARYGVITSGAPVVAMDPNLRPTLQNFHRKLIRWASMAGSRFGVEVIIRCTESTRKTLASRNLIGDRASYHFHANVVYRPKKYDGLIFATFLSWTRQFFGTHWSDAGKVQNVREIVKYMIKPTDLADAPGEELVWLYEATQKLKFIQALGPFAIYRRELNKSRLKVKSVVSSSGERETVLVKKDTRAPSRTAEMRGELEMHEQELISRLEREDNDEAVVEWTERLRDCRAELQALNAPCSMPNMIIAVLPPACRFVHYASPAVMVSGFTSLSELSMNPKFALLQQQAMTYWDANGAPSLDKVRQEIAAARAELRASGNEKFKKRKKWALSKERRKPRGRKTAPHGQPAPRPSVTLRVTEQSSGAIRA